MLGRPQVRIGHSLIHAEGFREGVFSLPRQRTKKEALREVGKAVRQSCESAAG